MDETYDARPDRIGAGTGLIARIERFYLAALRVVLLLLATVILVYAGWLAVSGAYRVSRNVGSVVEKPFEVTAAEVATLPKAVDGGGERPTQDPAATEKAFYKSFVDRYFALYQKQFAPFRQAQDRPLTRAAFDARYVRSSDRLAGLTSGDIEFGKDRAALDRLFQTMEQVATLPQTRDRLQRYKTATRRQVSRVISGVRPERYCIYYSDYLESCMGYDTRDVPYRRTVNEMRLPEGVTSPPDLFQSYQDRFFSLYTERSTETVQAAEKERSDILDANAQGGASLWRAVQVAGGFLIVMFLFLLIAIERHQRLLSRAFANRLDGDNERAVQ